MHRETINSKRRNDVRKKANKCIPVNSAVTGGGQGGKTTSQLAVVINPPQRFPLPQSPHSHLQPANFNRQANSIKFNSYLPSLPVMTPQPHSDDEN